MHPQFTELTPRWFKRAADVAEQDFPWDDDGVEALKAWLQSRYEAYCAANA